MLDELRIVDLGVIREATIRPHRGLTVVTGETGAGKTMIVSGLSLLLGGRADPGAVRTGAMRAVVEGRFASPALAVRERAEAVGGTVEDDELLIVRQVAAAGRSRAFVGGSAVPTAVSAEVAAELVTIHGQSEQLKLANAERQREMVDRWAAHDEAGTAAAERLAGYRRRYAERRAAATELAELRAAAERRLQEVDLLRFGLTEVERVDPQPGEDVALAAEARRLQSADDLRAAAQAALLGIAGDDDSSGGALAGIAAARRALDRSVPGEESLAALARQTADLGYAATELAAALAGYLADLEADPSRLEQIAARRSELAGVTRKYGPTCDDVLDWAARAVARLGAIESGDDRMAHLAAEVDRLDAELADRAVAITADRRRAADELGALVVAELADLAMSRARVAFEVTAGAELGPYGADRVELLFSANPGMEPRPLGRVASGGELSRLRLALEVVLSGGEVEGTLVFDEVDSGVGGRVAVEIGRRLAALARHTQVIVVTHLAQVAAFADRHYVVVKADDGQVSTSGVVALADDERAAELARMMAGLETTDSALAHARELLDAAGARATGHRR